jgi:hypothetical protein
MLMHYKNMYMPEHLSFVFTDTVKKIKIYIRQIVIPRIIWSVLFKYNWNFKSNTICLVQWTR